MLVRQKRMIFTDFFIYDGICSRRYGLRFANVDTKIIATACGEVEYNTTFSRATRSKYIDGKKYDESAISFDVEIISENPITDKKEIRQISKWLFNSPAYHKLYADYHLHPEESERIDGQIINKYVDCVFVKPEELWYGDGLHGWKCTCQCSSYMAKTDVLSISCSSIASDAQIVELNVDSDEQDYVFPRLVVEGCSGLSILNKSDDNRLFKLSGLSNKTLSVDCATGVVIDNTGAFCIDKVENQKLFRLVQGKNELEISGSTDKLTIKYQLERYIV